MTDWQRAPEYVVGPLLLVIGLGSILSPVIAPLFGASMNVEGPFFFVLLFAFSVGAPFFTLGTMMWPGRPLFARLAARVPALAWLAGERWRSALIVASVGLAMISVAFLWERPTGPGWDNFWVPVVLGGGFLVLATMVLAPSFLPDGDATFYVMTALFLSCLAATMLLVAAGRAAGGRMEIVEPVLWLVCLAVIALAGTTWRNAWRAVRDARARPPA